jgi:hypothetical protein
VQQVRYIPVPVTMLIGLGGFLNKAEVRYSRDDARLALPFIKDVTKVHIHLLSSYLAKLGKVNKAEATRNVFHGLFIHGYVWSFKPGSRPGRLRLWD